MVASFVGFTGFTLVMPFLALQFQTLGVVDVGRVALWTGVTLGVTPLVAALCAPLWGRIGDRFGNKVLVQRSLGSYVFLMVLMALSTRPWHLLALRAVQGLVAGYGVLTISMAARSAPPEQMALAIGWVQAAQRIAPAVGPVIGGLLSPVVGLRNTFFVAAVVYALAFLLFTVLYQEAAVAPVGQASAPVPFATILRFEHVALLMGVIFAVQLVDRSVEPVLLLYLSERGLGVTAATRVAGVLFSILALSGAVGNQLASALLSRVPARVVIAGAAIGAAAALVWFGSVADSWQLAAALGVAGTGLGVAATAAFTTAGGTIPAEAHGASFGFLTGASLVGSAAGSSVAGLVATHSMRVVFLTGAVLLTVLALIVTGAMGGATRERV